MTSTAALDDRPTDSLEALQAWIRHEISQCTGLSAGEVGLARSIHALGMSSVHVVRLAGELEERLGVEVDPTALYDAGSLQALCDSLWAMHRRRQRRDRDRPAGAAAPPARTVRQRPQLPTGYATPRTDWEQRLCALWCEVLKFDQVGIDDDFDTLGGDAHAAAEISERLWDLGVPESVRLAAGQAQTVATLSRAIESIAGHATLPLPPAGWRLEDDARLPEDIALAAAGPPPTALPPQRVLLTGATGYLGAFLLHEWMQQTQAHVTCLVRAATEQEGLERVRGNLRACGLDPGDLRGRLSVITGDLATPWLGHGRDAFKGLAAGIDAIVHCAAKVDFLSTYQRLKAANVDATRTLLRLACEARPRPIAFHYISTLGVAMSARYGQDAPIREDSPLLHADDLPNGYEQSKYVGDRMVWMAFRERGIPGAIYRPPLVGGPSDGTYPKRDEFLPRALKGCLQLGAFPALDSLLEIAPVDFVAQAIVHIARRPENLNKAYFVTHPHSRSIPDLIVWHQGAGWPVQALPWDRWRERLLGLEPARLRHNALAPFVDLLKTLSAAQACFPRIDNRQFRAATRALRFEPPGVPELLARYTRHFMESGFYDDVPGPAWAWGATPCESTPPAARIQPQGS